jgi:hypothetical protein
MLPNIRDDAINSIIGLTQSLLSYADYTQHLNDFRQRSRHLLPNDFLCVRFINSLTNLLLHTHAKSHRPNIWGTTCRSWSCNIF